jgi:hypothetical protein
MRSEPPVGVPDNVLHRLPPGGELFGAFTSCAVLPVRREFVSADLHQLAQQAGADQRRPPDLGAKRGASLAGAEVFGAGFGFGDPVGPRAALEAAVAEDHAHVAVEDPPPVGQFHALGVDAGDPDQTVADGAWAAGRGGGDRARVGRQSA